MGSVGLQVIVSALNLGSAFQGSLEDYFDQWIAYRSLPLSSLTALLNNRLTVANNNLNIGGALYNQIIDFLNYCAGAVSSGVTSIFNTSAPAFTYDMPGTYYLLPANTCSTMFIRNDNNKYINFTANKAVRLIRFVYTDTGVLGYCAFSDDGTSFKYSNTTQTDNVCGVNLTTCSYVSDNGTDIYYYLNPLSSAYNDIANWVLATQVVYINTVFNSDVNKNIAKYLYAIAWGVGAVGGTDGTISIPDPISRNYNDVNNKPFSGVGESDDVPIVIPGSFATDYPLTGTWDIPDSIPFAIPWVLDIPAAIDLPIDIPWFPDPSGELPPPSIPAPDPLIDIPLIVTPECESLSACLIAGVSTVSNHVNQFVHLHQELFNYLSFTLFMGFALLVLGVLL